MLFKQAIDQKIEIQNGKNLLSIAIRIRHHSMKS